MLRLEQLTDEEMDEVKKTFTRLAKSDAPLSDDEERTVRKRTCRPPKSRKAPLIEASNQDDRSDAAPGMQETSATACLRRPWWYAC